jgi:hypothetical protein
LKLTMCQIGRGGSRYGARRELPVQPARIFATVGWADTAHKPGRTGLKWADADEPELYVLFGDPGSGDLRRLRRD